MFFAAGFQISDVLYLSAQPLRPRSFPGHSHYETCGDYMSINDEFVDQGFFFWHWLPVLLSRQEIVVWGAPYPTGLRSFLPKQTLLVCWLSATDVVFISAVQTCLYQHPKLSFCFRDHHVRVFTPRCGSLGFEVLPRFNPCDDTHHSRGTQGVLVIVYPFWIFTLNEDNICETVDLGHSLYVIVLTEFLQCVDKWVKLVG